MIWVVPAAVALLGAGTLMWAGVERVRVRADLRRGFEAHATSIARLIREGAGEAAASIDTIYALSEQNLALAVRLTQGPGQEPADVEQRARLAGLEVLVSEERPGGFTGAWGSVSGGDRPSLLQQVMSAPAGEIVETGAAGEPGLFCAHYRPASSRVVACKRGEELSELRRRTGIGPLLRQVAQHDVLYAAIQDGTGIIAASPGARLSAWQDDPELGLVLEGEQGLRFRTVEPLPARIERLGEPPVFEGLGPIDLPDGTRAVLRVGVDASSMARVLTSIERRHRLLFFAICALVLLSMGAAWILDRVNNRRLQTERRLAEREQENRRWQTVGEMAATVAHEVRNPLNTIQMAAQRLRLEFEVEPQSRAEYGELVSLLGSESERVNRVVGDFLELGRPVGLEPATELLPGVMEQSLLPLRLRADKEGKHLQLGSVPEAEVWLDRRRFLQIVSNLGGNALDAVAEGGSVRLSARLDAGNLLVEIEDDGAGMDAQTLRQALRPFFTTKSSGTGLGLPLARRLVEAHGGELEIFSSPGRGTRVRISLPGKAMTG